MSGWETFFAAAITAAAAAGLAGTTRFWDRERRRRQAFRYYTNLSNLAMLLTHALLLIPGPHRAALLSPTGRYMATLCILVTFVIFFFVLTRCGRVGGQALAALGVRRVTNLLVHYLVPGLTALEWLTVADKRGLGLADALLWLVIPLGYLALCLQRARAGAVIGNTGSLWPYGFMDLTALGLKKWLRNIGLTLLGFFALGVLLLGVSRLYT